jgi:hypothetical protein
MTAGRTSILETRITRTTTASSFIRTRLVISRPCRSTSASITADFRHNGALDIVVGHSFARCHTDPMDDSECYATQQVRFFENQIGANGNYIELTLTGGPNTNRSAIGARVMVTAAGITQTQEVGGGHGHYGQQDDLTLHFGLADACEADVTVRWPDASLTTQSFHVPAGYRFTVTQGADPTAVIDK